jgi:uncharacterized protein (UPF0335 family)
MIMNRIARLENEKSQVYNDVKMLIDRIARLEDEKSQVYNDVQILMNRVAKLEDERSQGQSMTAHDSIVIGRGDTLK